MDGQELNFIQRALRLLEPLQDAENWYDETPKLGGPEVTAWRGKGDPEQMARIAHRDLEAVVSKYIGVK